MIALILRETAVVLAAGLGSGILLAMACVSLAVVAAASYLPAWRAASVNPVMALRHLT